MPPDNAARRAVRKRIEPRGFQQRRDAAVAFAAILAEKPAEEFDVLAHAEVGIEVSAKALRHIGDARADRGAVARVADVAAEHENRRRPEFASPRR